MWRIFILHTSIFLSHAEQFFIDSTGENLVTNFLIVGRKPFPATHKYNLADISDGLRGDRIKTNLAYPPKSKIFGEAEVSGGEDSLKYLGIWT